MKHILLTSPGVRTALFVGVGLLVSWAAFPLARPLSLQTKTVTLSHAYRSDEPSLVEVSSNGKLLLALGRRRVECGKNKCDVTTLTVYNADTGLRIGELIPDAPERSVYFYAAYFIQGFQVRATEWRYRPAEKKGALTGIQWDPSTNSRSTFVMPEALNDFQPACGINNDGVLGVITDRSAQSWRYRLSIADGKHIYELQQPEIPVSVGRLPFWSFLGENCTAYKSGNSYLIATGDAPGSSLYWVSLEWTTRPRLCHTFAGESLDGHAVSPDGKFVAAITSNIIEGVPGGAVPEFHAFLNVLDGESCKLLRKSELEFPEGPPKWKPPFIRTSRSVDLLDNVHFGHQFAKQLAISPDNSKLALAYGHFKDSDGIAFFGIYSFTDGHRLATLRGETNKAGILHGALIGGELYAQSAPLSGRLQFSPDSRALYASSKYLLQWDGRIDLRRKRDH